MAFEALKAEIALLVSQLGEQPHDRRELEFMLSRKLRELRAFGLPLPEDLVELEAALDFEITRSAREQARSARHPGSGRGDGG